MKLAVMGSAPSSVRLAPFQNEAYRKWIEGRTASIAQAHAQVPGEWEIWGCSPACWAAIPRATRWFEVHRWEPTQPWFGPEYSQFLRDYKGIVYTGGIVPEIPNHVLYPIDYIEDKFSSYFLTSSLALMQALAIDHIERLREQRAILAMQRAGQATAGLTVPQGMSPEQFEAELEKPDSDDAIGLWGVDMAAGDEYAYQRPGCQFFILEAMRRGIGVFVPPESDLMRPMPVYGISEWDHNYIKLTTKAREMSARGNEAQANLAQAQTQLTQAQTEQMVLNYFVSTWTSPYGMRAGMILHHVKGSGLGSGITQYDGRPIERMLNLPPQTPGAVGLQAMAEPAEVQRAREYEAILEQFRKEHGWPASSAGELLLRLMAEARIGREHSTILQPYAHPGESSADVIKRALQAAIAKSPKAKGGKSRRR